jgi:hypothetical protein
MLPLISPSACHLGREDRALPRERQLLLGALAPGDVLAQRPLGARVRDARLSQAEQQQGDGDRACVQHVRALREARRHVAEAHDEVEVRGPEADDREQDARDERHAFRRLEERERHRDEGHEHDRGARLPAHDHAVREHEQVRDDDDEETRPHDEARAVEHRKQEVRGPRDDVLDRQPARSLGVVEGDAREDDARREDRQRVGEPDAPLERVGQCRRHTLVDDGAPQAPQDPKHAAARRECQLLSERIDPALAAGLVGLVGGLRARDGRGLRLFLLRGRLLGGAGFSAATTGAGLRTGFGLTAVASRRTGLAASVSGSTARAGLASMGFSTGFVATGFVSTGFAMGLVSTGFVSMGFVSTGFVSASFGSGLASTGFVSMTFVSVGAGAAAVAVAAGRGGGGGVATFVRAGFDGYRTASPCQR